MHTEAITKKTKSVLEKIASSQIAKDFYLAGGTALALHLGHRESIDLDCFSEKDFSLPKLKSVLASLGKLGVTGEDLGTLHGTLNGVKITFLKYDYAKLYPLIKFENAKMADERDIAAMKIDAISSRGSRKDFIDLYFLLEKYSLEDLLEFFQMKFKNVSYNKLHILKSLVYFEDADNEPMPRMIQKVEWKKVKEVIRKKVNELIHLK